MIGRKRHRVVFENPVRTRDGEGGYTEAWTPCSPPLGWFVQVTPASPQDLERVAAGTVINQATNLIRGDYLPGVTNQTRMLMGGRVYKVAGHRNVEERGIDMELLAVELQAT